MFCGKAVKLLQIARENIQNNSQMNNFNQTNALRLNPEEREVFDYLAGLNSTDYNKNSNSESNKNFKNSTTNDANYMQDRKENFQGDDNNNPMSSLLEYIDASGFAPQVIFTIITANYTYYIIIVFIDS
jgi:hypothetical protein